MPVRYVFSSYNFSGKTLSHVRITELRNSHLVSFYIRGSFILCFKSKQISRLVKDFGFKRCFQVKQIFLNTIPGPCSV